MKKKNVLIMFYCLFVAKLIYTDAISVVVPKEYLKDKASLVLFMKDGFGNECVGSYRLDEKVAGQMILQKDLRVEYEKSFEQLFETNECIDVTDGVKNCDNETVVYFDLDNDVSVLRILIIKDSIFFDNPFEICCIPLQSSEEVDLFSSLVDGVEETQDPMQTTHDEPYSSMLLRYSFYVQIYVLMKYFHIKRKISDMYSWMSLN